MDYFKFDLQLFAVDLSLDLTEVSAVLATGTKYCGVKEGVVHWYDTKEEAKANEQTLTATLAGGVLTVAAGDEADTTMTLEGVTAAQMKGVTVKLAKDFSGAGDVAVVRTTTASLTFADDSLKHMTVSGLGNPLVNNVAFDAETACKVTLSQDVTLTVPHPANTEKTMVLTPTAGDLVVLSDGKASHDVVISGFANGETYTMVDNSSTPAETGTLTVKTGAAGKLDIAVTGTQVGHWVGLADDTAKLTVSALNKVFSDASGNVDAVDFPGPNESGVFPAGTLKLTATTAAVPQYYKVTWDSENKKYVVDTAKNSKPEAAVDLVGYFKLTVADNTNRPSATLTFHAGTSDTVSSLIADVPIDAEGLETITLAGGSKATLKKLVVTGVTYNEDDVELYHLPTTATVTGIGSDDQIISYAPTYEVVGGLSLDGTLAADKTTYFTVTPTKTTTGKNTKITYTIAASETQPTAESKVAYYKVVYNEAAIADPPTAAKTYKVTYVANDNTGDTKVDMTQSCWAGVAINGDGLAAGKHVIIDSAGEGFADTYVITAKSGVGIKEADAYAVATVTRTGDTIATLTNESGEVQKITLTSANKFYQVVVDDSDCSTELTTSEKFGKPTVSIKTAVAEAPAAPYFEIVTSENTYTLVYHNTDGTKRLSGLVKSDGTPFRIEVDATGIGAGKTVVIDDGAQYASTNVDYAITHLPAGTEVTGANEGTGKGTDTLAYDDGFVANNIIALAETVMPTADGSATTNYKVTWTASTGGKGVKDLTVTKMTAAPVATDDNYFTVTATKSGDTKTYTVAYHLATGAQKGIDISAATGALNISTADLAAGSVSGIYLVTNEKVEDAYPARIPAAIYKVTDLDEAAMVTSEANIKTRVLKAGDPTDTPVVDDNLSYVDYYALGAKAIDLDDGKTYEKTYFVATTATVKGTHTVGLAVGVHTLTAEQLESKSYFLATAKDGVVTLTFHEGTEATATKKTELAKLKATDQFTVDADSLAATVKSLVLTDDATVAINYDVQDVPYSLTNGVTNVTANDKVTYTKSYVLSDSANSIALGSTEGTVYYAVTATGGADTTTDRGRYTCSIASAGVTIADDDPEKAEKIAKLGGNYFKVATLPNGNVNISYTSGGTTPLILSGSTPAINVVIDAAKAASTATIAIVDDAKTVNGYTVNNLVATQTGIAATHGETVKNNYETSYAIKNNNIVLDITTDAAGAYPAVRYYSITQTKTGTEGQHGVIEYTLSAKLNQTQFDALGDEAKKHYVKINYASAWNVSVAYVNTDNNPNFDLSDTAIGRLTVNASALKGTTVDTLNIDKTDKANYEITGVVKSQITVDCDTTKDVVNYDVEAKLAAGQKFSLTTDDEAYYLVTAPKSGSSVDVTACTVAKTTKDKCTDTANYFKVTKSGSAYVIEYVTAKSGDALDLAPTTSTITVDASAAKSDASITVSSAAATVALTDVPGAVTFVDAGNVTATYKSTFAWAKGKYFIPVKDVNTGASVAADGTAVSITKADSEKVYAVVTVGMTEAGVYSLTVADNVQSPNSTSGLMTNGAAYTQKAAATITAPAVEGWQFDANNVALTEIKALPNKAVLTNAGNVVKITSAELASGGFFKVGATTYTSGAANNVITVTGAGKVEGGTLLITGTDEVVSTTVITGTAAGFYTSIQLVDAGNGVTVTFDKIKGITAINGLDKGECVKVKQVATVSGTPPIPASYVTYQYALSDDGKYIERTITEGGSGTTKAGVTTGDILGLNYEESVVPVPVGQFIWSTGVYYVEATGAAGAAALTTSASPTGVAQDGKYYVKAEITGGNTLALTPVKGNAANLVDKTDAFTGTVTITNPGIAFSYIKTGTEKFHVDVKGAKTGSTFGKLGAGDSVISEAGASITLDDTAAVVYAAVAGKTLEFVGSTSDAGVNKSMLKNGELTTGTGLLQLAGNSSDPATSVVASQGATIVVENGKLTSLKGMETDDETVTVNTYAADGTTIISTKVYTYDHDNDDKVTMVETITATGQKITQVFKPAAPGGEVLGLTPESTTGTVASNWAWGTEGKYGYFTDPSGAIAIGDSATSPLPYTKTAKIIKATITKVTGTTPKVNTLTLTPMIVGSDGVTLVEDKAGAYDGTVTITLPANNAVVYDATSKSMDYKVAFVDVAEGSELILAKGDTVATADFNTSAKTVKVNGVTFTADVNTTTTNKLSFYSDGTHARIMTGVILTKGTVYSTALADKTKNATLAYTPGATEDGVIAAYVGTTGDVETVKDLEAGEKVVITGTNGKTTTYEGRDGLANLVWKTADGVTTVGTVASTADILTGVYTAVVDGTAAGKKTFDWGATDAGLVGNFLVTGESGKGTVSVAAGETALSYQNVGKTYLVGTYVTAAGGTQYQLTFQKATAGATGALGAAVSLNGTATGGTEPKSITIDAGGKTVKYAKDYIETVTVTGAGAGSAFTGGFDTDKISVTTKALAKNETLTINTTVYTAGEANDVLTIEKGKLVGGVFAMPATTAYNTYHRDATTKETISSVVTSAASTAVNVKVVDGVVKAVTGLDVQNEQVTVNTTTTEKDGTQTVVNTVYLVTAVAEKAFTVKKTETVNGKTTIYTQTFTTATQDVTTTSGWTVADMTTAGTFNWTNSGYWKVTLDGNGKYVLSEDAKIATGKGYSITSATPAGTKYIALESKQNLDGSYTVTNVSLVEVQENGALTEAKGAIGEITITAPAGANLTLPTTHDGVFTIEGAPSLSYVAAAQDTVECTFTAADQIVVVGGTTYTNKATTEQAPNNDYYKNAAIMGNGTIAQGMFQIKGTATGSAVPTKVNPTADKTIVYTPGTGELDGKDGVTVKFYEGEIEGVTGLDNGEKVVITGVKYEAEKGYKHEYTIEKKAGKITKTLDSSLLPTKLVMTSTDATDVYKDTNFRWENKFDFGATADGVMGIFKADGLGTGKTVTIAAQTDDEGANPVPAKFTTSTQHYVIVGGKKSGGVYTIGHLQVMSYREGAGLYTLDPVNSDSIAGLTITAPTDGNLTLASDAYQPNPDNPADKDRGYAITVMGTAGRTYTGFAAKDSVRATLNAGEIITVGTAEYKAATTDSVYIGGTGIAQTGDFTVESAKHKVTATEDGVGGTKVVEWTKGDGVRVTVKGGRVTKITGLGVGEEIKVTTTTAAGAKTVETYSAAKGTTGVLVTKTVVEEGSTTKYTKTLADDSANILDADDWAQGGDVTTTGKFTWKAADGPGFFEVSLDTTKKTLGAVTVEPQSKAVSISKANKGKYYLKVTPAADNTVTAAGVYTPDATTGELKAVDLAGYEGVIIIIAPDKALNYANVITEPKVNVNITNAAKNSVVVLKTGDTLTTAKLAANEAVTVNATPFTAGAASALSFAKDDGAAPVAVFSGTLALGQNADIYGSGAKGALSTDNMRVQVSNNAGDKATVTFANGVVAKVEGLTGTLTTTQDGVGAAYAEDGAVNVTGMADGKTATLAALGKGKAISLAGTPAYVSAKDGNMVTLVQEGANVTVQDGVLTLESGKTIYATGTSSAADNYKIDFTLGTGSTSTPTITIENGKVVAVEGLGAGTAGDKLVILETPATGSATTTTYQLDATGTKVTKTVKVGTAEPTTATAFIAKGSDLLKASFINGATAGGQTLEDNPIVGQFSWNDISGRATGYFAIGDAAKNSASVVEQSAEVELKVNKSADKRYVVATVSNADDLAGNPDEARALSLGVMKVTKAGVPTTEGVTLSAADTIKIAAPTSPVVYTKAAADLYHVEFTKVAKNSIFNGLAASDKVTTDTLAVGDKISVDGGTSVYVAGAKGQLAFIGQSTGNPAVTNTALLNGTIKLSNVGGAIPAAAVLAGDSKTETGTSANDVTVTVAGTVNREDVIVKVANGKVTSITGVKTAGTTVTVAIAGDKTYLYTAEDATGTMFSVSTDGGASKTYRAVTAGSNFYSEGGTAYKDLTLTKVTPLNWTGAGTVNTYVTLADDLATAATISKGSADLKTADFRSDPAKYYLNLKGSTAQKSGIDTLTITGMTLMQADGSGTLKAVSAKAANQYNGQLNINTSDGGAPAKYAAVVYKLPTGTARVGGWNLAGTVGLGSDLTNLAAVDKIDTADGTFTFGTNGKSFKIYKAATTGTEETKVTYAGADKAVATVTGQAVATVTGMTTGKLTIEKNDEDKGLVTTVYEWKTVNKVATLYRTITEADGTVTVDTMTAAGAGGDIIGATYTANAATAINSVFDWTLDKSATGYFAAATNGTAAVKALTTNIKDTRKDTKTYVKVTLDEASKMDAVVDTAGAVTAVKFNATTGAEEASTFSGKLTITAPKTALTFDRATAFDATMAGTTVAITGAAKQSNITGLLANDTVATASLTKNTDSIWLGGCLFTAGAAGAMEFTVQEINTDDLHYTLTKGTAVLNSAGAAEGVNELYAGTALITALTKNDGGVNVPSVITVAASTTAKGTTFTIGGLGENEQFTVKNAAWTQVDGSGVTFTRSGSSLFCTYYSEAEGKTVTKVYSKLGTAADVTVTSAILEKAFNDPAKVPAWSTLTATFDDSTGVEKSDYVINTIDLATMDKRITSEKNAYKKNFPNAAVLLADYVAYEFVVDKYVSAGTKAGTKLNAAIVANAADGYWQETLGTVVNSSGTRAWSGYNWYTAAAHGEVGQNIKAAVNWSVVGSIANDTITGASGNGSATIAGGAGNDTITAGSANETFEFNTAGGGKDVLKSYTAFANNKGDKLDVAGFNMENIYLAGTGLDTNGKTKLTGVLIHDGTYNENTGAYTNGMLLVGVAGKAVKINTDIYFFGDGTKTKGAATFNYQTGAYYIANEKMTNTLKVATDKNKATKTTLGDTVEIDLNAEGLMGSYYTNIDVLDGSASANSLILTAAAKGSTVKGGTYLSTLRGGSGNDVLQGGGGADVFSFKDGLSGNDTIKSFTSKKDSVYVGQLGDGDGIDANGIEISAQGNNVVLKQNNDTVTIEGAVGAAKALWFSKDGTTTNTLSYYVGAAGKKNNFTEANVGTDVKVTNTASAYKAVDDTTVLKEIDFVSRYIGSTDVDTVKLKATKDTISGALSIADARLTSIDVLDASLVKAGSTLALIGGADNCTLKGSASNLSKEKFFIQTAAGKTTVVQNLTALSDIIELGAGVGITGTATQKGANVIFTLDNNSTLQIDGVKAANLQLGTNGAGNVTIKRTK